MFLNIFLMMGIGTITNWSALALTSFLNWEDSRQTQLVYNLVGFTFLWSQLWVGWNITAYTYLSANWPYLFFGYFLYETGYMIEHRKCFSPHGYRVWIQHHLLSLVLIVSFIICHDLNYISVTPYQAKWIYYWHWTTNVYFTQLIYSIYRNKIDWHYWYVRIATFIVQHLLRTIITVITIVNCIEHSWVLVGLMLPVGCTFEFLDIYYDVDSIYRLYIKLLKA